jgi:hypothetical protein
MLFNNAEALPQFHLERAFALFDLLFCLNMTNIALRKNDNFFTLRRNAKSFVSTDNGNQLKMNILTETKTSFNILS